MDDKDTKKTTTSGKGKGKNKKQTVSLHDFVGANNTQAGFTALPAVRWSDVMDNEDEDSTDFNKDSMVILPTAPKSVRGPDIDVNTVPTQPPYICFLSNLPFEVTEDEIRKFFRDLKVMRIEIFREPGSTRTRGQGTCEFEDRQSLIDAFSLHQETIKNRPIKIHLRSNEQDRDYNRRDYRSHDDGDDRTAGDWRSGGTKSDFKPMNNFSSSNRPFQERDNSFGYNRNRDGGYNRNNYGDSYDRNNFNNYGGGGGQGRDRNSNRNYSHNSYSNYQSDYQNSGRDDYSRGDNYKMGANDSSGHPSIEDEPVRERPKLILQKRSTPIPDLLVTPIHRETPKSHDQHEQELPPHAASTHQINSNRRESESSETQRDSIPFEPAPPTERKRLVLLKKSDVAQKVEPVKPNPSIFGDAKPVDTAKKILEMEQKQSRLNTEKDLSEKFEKQSVSGDTSENSPARERSIPPTRSSNNGPHSNHGKDTRFYDQRSQYNRNRRMNNNQTGNFENFHNNHHRSNKFGSSGIRQMDSNDDQYLMDNQNEDWHSRDDQRSMNRVNVGSNKSIRNQEALRNTNRFSGLEESLMD